MNILPFVMVMLMLLTALTYGRLQSYRSFKGFTYAINLFLEKGEREKFNKAMEDKYDLMKGQDGSGGGGSSVKAASKLNLNVFLNSSSDPKRASTYLQLAKELIHQLYSDQPYFQELEKKRPTYLDELFNVLANLDQKFKTLSDLDNVKLQDPVLNELLYRLLKESVEGSSFRKCVTIYNQNDIRVFLAPKELLLAIYKDLSTVESLIEKREELYRLVSRKEGLSIKEASDQFNIFTKRFSTDVDPYLNTEVSKTDPRR